MAMFRFPSVLSVPSILKSRFSTTSSLNYKWRKKLKIEPNPYMYSPLTLRPDYSFVDGRPTILTWNQKNKIDLQQKYLQRIKELTHEVDVAVEVYDIKQQKLREERENIIKNKLKPKGEALLKKNDQ